jgi:branched-chain amino acid transport system ATP-binding protein
LAHRIVLRDVDAGQGAVRVLHRVSLTVNDGEPVVLLGTNGNDKSTLMRCIVGLVPVDAGESILEADGRRIDLVGLAPETIVNLGITLVPEGRRLFPKLTVEENLLLGAYRAGARQGIASNLLTVLMAEQNFQQATRIADRGYIVVYGAIAFEGHTTQELSEHKLVKRC